MKKMITLIGMLVAISSASAQVLSLDECVRWAMERNESVLKAKQSLRQAESHLKEVTADQYPLISLTAGYERGKEEGQYERESGSIELNISQRFLRLGAIPPEVDEALEEVRRAQLELERVKMEIESEVRVRFFRILLIEMELDERRKMEAEIAEKLRRIRKRREAGLLRKVSLLNAELELLEQRVSIHELERERDITTAELGSLIGWDPERELRVKGELPKLEWKLDEAIRMALQNRIDLKDLRGQIERQERIVREARLRRLPEITASLKYHNAKFDLSRDGLTWDGKLELKGRVKRWGEEEGERWRTSLSLNLPIFDGYRARSRLEVEMAKLEMLRLALRKREKAVGVEVRRAYREAQSAEERVKLEEKRMELSRESLRLIETLLESPVETREMGTISFETAIRARISFTQSQRSYFQSRRAAVEAVENLWRMVFLSQPNK